MALRLMLTTVLTVGRARGTGQAVPVAGGGQARMPAPPGAAKIKYWAMDGNAWGLYSSEIALVSW
jgi:hypothetical protein